MLVIVAIIDTVSVNDTETECNLTLTVTAHVGVCVWCVRARACVRVWCIVYDI